MVTFNNIPTTIRLPGSYTEVDNSRALKGTAANPQKVLILGQMTSDGSASTGELKQITSEMIGNGFFGAKSVLGRMCRQFKKANPYTETYAIALDSSGGVRASGALHFSVSLSHAGGSVSTSNEIVHFAINGDPVEVTLENLWSVADVNSAVAAAINALPYCPVVASVITASAKITLIATNSGTLGNGIDIRFNSRTGEALPACFGDSVLVSVLASGAGDPDIDAAWSVIENEQYHYIVCPYTDQTNLDFLKAELETRFGPMEDKQGHGFVAFKGTAGECSTEGKLENSPYISILGFYKGQQTKEEWAAVFGAVAAYYLNDDPARPLQTLKLPNIIAPDVVDRFTNTERNLLLYDGISTWNVDANGNVLLERIVTTYRTDSAGNADASYLNVETMATLSEIRYQYRVRMWLRFLSQRFKLADDSFPVQPGMKVATPKTIKQEIIALFAELEQKGLIENLSDFSDNLIVERNATDRDRIDVLLPPDLINQFRILATQIQFIL
jgi:phage tail sheath gpL-like